MILSPPPPVVPTPPLQQRCPYSVEQLSSLLPGRQVISYSGLLSISQAAQSSPSRLSPVLDGPGASSSSSPSRGAFRSSVAARSKSFIGAGGHGKRPSLSGSIGSMSGIMGGGASAASTEVLDTYSDKVDALLRKIIRQRRDDDPAVRAWFDEAWGVPVEAACILDGCRLRHFKDLHRIDGSEQPPPPPPPQTLSPPIQQQPRASTDTQSDAGFALDLGRFSPFDAGSRFHSPAPSRSSTDRFELASRNSQELPVPSRERLGSFAEETPSALATPRIPCAEDDGRQATTTPRPDRVSPADTLYDSEGMIEAELKWILETFPLPPPKGAAPPPPAPAPTADKYTPAFTTTQLSSRQPRSRTPPPSAAAVEIRLRQASVTPSSTYSARSTGSRDTFSTAATTVSVGSRNRGSTSTCGSAQTDFSDAPKGSSRESTGPLTPKSLNGGADGFLSVVGGDSTPRDDGFQRDWRPDGGLVSPTSLAKPLPDVASWRPTTPPRPPPSQLPPPQSRPPPAGPPPVGPPPPPPPGPAPAAPSRDERPFAAQHRLEGSHLALGEPIKLPTGPRQFASMSVLPAPANPLGLAGQPPSPRKGSLVPASLETSPDGHRYHRPHQGMLNPYLRSSPSVSLRTLPSIRSTSSTSPEPSLASPSAAMPRSATSATLAVESDRPLKVFKIFIPSAERTVSVPVSVDDSLLDLRERIAAKLRRTNLELPGKWSLATAQLSATREKIVGEQELASLLAGKLRNGDPAQPCLLRVIEA